MNQKTQTQPRVVANMFADYTFVNTLILVTDDVGQDIQVAEGEIFQSNIPVDENRYIKVYYYEQEYWLSKELHFPI